MRHLKKDEKSAFCSPLPWVMRLDFAVEVVVAAVGCSAGAAILAALPLALFHWVGRAAGWAAWLALASAGLAWAVAVEGALVPLFLLPAGAAALVMAWLARRGYPAWDQLFWSAGTLAVAFLLLVGGHWILPSGRWWQRLLFGVISVCALALGWMTREKYKVRVSRGGAG